MTDEKRRKRPVIWDPWDRKKGESSQAFEAFHIYRDMGEDRSNAKVARQLGKSVALMNRWSSRWAWVDRSAAWDNELDRQGRKAQIKAVKDMNARHAKLGMLLQSTALESIKQHRPEYVANLGPRHARDWVATGVDVERKARGQPTEVIEDRRPQDQEALAALTDEDLGQLEGIMAKTEPGDSENDG